MSPYRFRPNRVSIAIQIYENVAVNYQISQISWQDRYIHVSRFKLDEIRRVQNWQILYNFIKSKQFIWTRLRKNLTDSTNHLDIMKNFNEMHDNAILEIFNFLDVKSLKTATEVCKKWNKIISDNSVSLSELRKLKFVFTMDWKKKTAEMDRKSMLRLVSTVEFKGLSMPHACHHTEIDDEIIEILSIFHKQIRVLILDRVEIDVGTFRKLLSIFKLDKLIIRRLNFSGIDSNDAAGQAAISSDHHDKVLQMLALAHPSETTLNILIELKYQTTKLALNVDIDYDHDSNFSNSAFARFMRNQKCIKQFVVKSASWDDVRFNLIIEQLKSSKLEQLAIEYREHGNDKCITNFIKSQSALKELEIETPRISTDTIKAIYETENLQFLRLTNDGIIKNIELPNPSRPHANLKKVVMDLLNWDAVGSFDVMLRMFANIEELQINSLGGVKNQIATNKILLSAQKHLKSLKFFDVSRIPKDFQPMAIPSLEKFHINESLLSWTQVKLLLSHNPSLKELRVYDINGINENIKNKCKFTSGMLRELSESCPKFKKIEICNMEYVVIDETVAADSPIEVVKVNNRRHGFRDAFTQSLFGLGRTNDVDDMCSIWTKTNNGDWVDNPDYFTDVSDFEYESLDEL